MATTSFARGFRKINIEQYDEDFYVDENIQDPNCRAPDANQVNSLLSSGKPQVRAIFSINNVDATLHDY